MPPNPNYQSLNVLERHNHSRQISLYHKGICVVQENEGFSAGGRVKNAVNLSSDYLAVPNNLLLSLSLSCATGVTSPQDILSYARETTPRNPFRQRTSTKFRCPVFVMPAFPVCKEIISPFSPLDPRKKQFKMKGKTNAQYHSFFCETMTFSDKGCKPAAFRCPFPPMTRALPCRPSYARIPPCSSSHIWGIG